MTMTDGCVYMCVEEEVVVVLVRVVIIIIDGDDGPLSPPCPWV
jgi:hypothetical protein